MAIEYYFLPSLKILMHGRNFTVIQLFLMHFKIFNTKLMATVSCKQALIDQ